MKHFIATLVFVGFLLACTNELMAGKKDDQTSADRATYSQLIRKLRKDHQALTNAWAKATQEARTNDGQATGATKARVLSLRDSLDRKTTRLLLISLRHGWDMPDFSAEQKNDGTIRQISTGKREIFAPVDAMVRSALAKEAVELASKVKLPVISLASSTKAETR